MSLLLLEDFDGGAAEFEGRAIEEWDALSTGSGRTGNGIYMTNTPRYIGYDVINHATCIMGVAHNGGTDAYEFIRFRSDTGATVHCTLYKDASGDLHVYRGTSSGALLGSSTTTPITASTWDYVEMKVALHDTTGTVDVYVNGTSVISLTGQDTKNGGTKTVFDRAGIYYVGSADNTYFDDLYICDGAGSTNNDVLGPITVEEIRPNGNGNYSDLLGSDADSTDNYLLVDEAGSPVTADYVGSATNADVDTYAFEDVAGGDNVFGVELRLHVQKSDAGTKRLRPVHRRASTDSTGSDHTLSDSWSNHYVVYDRDPNGPTDWTATNLNSSEFGIEVRP